MLVFIFIQKYTDIVYGKYFKVKNHLIELNVIKE